MYELVFLTSVHGYVRSNIISSSHKVLRWIEIADGRINCICKLQWKCEYGHQLKSLHRNM